MIKQPSGSKEPKLNSTSPTASNSNNKQIFIPISWMKALRPCLRRHHHHNHHHHRYHLSFFSTGSSSLVGQTPISLISVPISTTSTNRLTFPRNLHSPPILLLLLLPPPSPISTIPPPPPSIILNMEGMTSIPLTIHQISSHLKYMRAEEHIYDHPLNFYVMFA